jgi:enoyl-CoA hydratase/carnithine racemase
MSFPAHGVGLLLMADSPMNFGTNVLAGEIHDRLIEVRDAGCRVVVLASDVPGYFMAHSSLDDVLAARGMSNRPVEAGDRWRLLGRELYRGPMISIAANNGQAWGAGSELSWCCNLRTAAESATYGQPEVLLGVVPGGGGTTRLPHLIGEARALEMLLGGAPIDARTALHWGLINKVVPDDDLRSETLAWAEQLATRPPWALDAIKQCVVQGQHLSRRDAASNASRIAREAVRPEIRSLVEEAMARYARGDDSYGALGLIGVPLWRPEELGTTGGEEWD